MRFQVIPLFLLLLAAGAGRTVARSEASRVYTVKRTEEDITVRFRLSEPVIEEVQASDGQRYCTVTLRGAGRAADPGAPDLPVLQALFETPRFTPLPRVFLKESSFRTVQLTRPVLPVQEPVEKRPGSRRNRRFLRLERFYRGRGYRSPDAEKEGSWYRLEPVKTRNVPRFLLKLYLCSVNPESMTLKVPERLTVVLTWQNGPVQVRRRVRSASRPEFGRRVSVGLGSKQDLQELVREGFTIASVKGDAAVVYATAEEEKLLKTKGFPVEAAVENEAGPEARDGGVKGGGDDVYHSFAALSQALSDLAAAYPELCHVESIGSSVEGREIWAVKISDNVTVDETEPEVRFVAAMHGDEPPAMELCLSFIERLLSSYPDDARVERIVDNVELWVIPLLNPDGFAAGTRYNADGIDLNRSFPDRIQDPVNTTTGRPPETQALMEFCDAHSFVLAANFHTGAVVVNYPYDSNETGFSTYTACDDDALFHEISARYAAENPDMTASTVFPGGITNGAEWYVVYGGLQDWSYVWKGTNEVTIEVWDVHKPTDPAALATIWEHNRSSMMTYIESVFTGVSGIVRDDEKGRIITDAKVMLSGADHKIPVDPRTGIYHRMLLPGTYTLVFWAPGYAATVASDVEVVDSQVTALDVVLKKSETGEQKKVLVAAHQSLEAGALAMLDYYRAKGYDADEYLFEGSPAAADIRAAISAIYQEDPFQYLLLLGDTDTLPAFLYRSHDTDFLYSLLDPGEDWNDIYGRDVVVGRLPLDTFEEVDQYRLKLQAFEETGRNRRFCWLAHGDDNWECTTSRGTHEWILDEIMPQDKQNTTYWCDQGSRAEFFGLVDGGIDVVAYSGHGLWDRWEKWELTVSALAQLDNANDPPAVFSFACDTGKFGRNTCFGEAWIRDRTRGAVFVGSSDATYWEEDDILEKKVFQDLFTDESLSVGELLYGGLAEVDLQSGEGDYYHQVYHVLGDPTLSLVGGFGVVEVEWDDGGNGIPEPGDAGTLRLVVVNRSGRDRFGVQVLLETDHPDIVIDTMLIDSVDFPAGGREALSFSLSIQEDCAAEPPPSFSLSFAAADYEDRTAFDLEVTSIFSVSGGVVFAGSGEAVAGALVEVDGPVALQGNTDETGAFSFELHQGAYSLQVSYPDYCTETMEFAVPPSDQQLDIAIGWSEGELTPGVLDVSCVQEIGCSEAADLFNKGTRPLSFSTSFAVDRDTETGGYAAFTQAGDGVPGFDWVDTGAGQLIHQGYMDDMVWGPYSVPFDFPFFGQVYNSVYICSNGFISFADPGGSFYNSVELPSHDGPPLAVAPFWRDLVVKENGAIVLLADEQQCVVEFRNVALFNSTALFSIQVVFSADGTIRCQYRDVPAGADHVVCGMQDETALKGLTVDLETAGDDVVFFSDQPQWIHVDPAAGVVEPGAVLPLRFTFTAQPAGTVDTATCLLSTTSPRVPDLSLPVTVQYVEGEGFYFLRGDGNQDGAVDLSDAVQVLGYLFASKDAPCVIALDANTDGGVDISDAVFLLNYLFSQGAPPQAPFPECGLYAVTGSSELTCSEEVCRP